MSAHTLIAIPAACLEALGGLERNDPPVLLQCLETGEEWPWHPCGPSSPYAHVDAHLLLPASNPTLAHVLARHHGLHLPYRGCVSWRRGDLGWRLETVPPPGGYPGGSPPIGTCRREFLGPLSARERAYVERRRQHRDWRGVYVDVDTIEDLTDPDRALAEVVVWEARVARMKRTRPPVGWPAGTSDAEILAFFETTEPGLPEWRVEVSS